MCEQRARHDLNNLLAKILASAEMALDQSDAVEIRRELNLIATLTEECADLLRSGRAHPDPGA
jgi:hypothetical protein